MSKKDIFVYGEIYSDQSEYASDWGIVSLTTIKNQLEDIPEDTDEIIVHINSPGGDVFEGFGIHDYLRGIANQKNIQITTIIEGLSASIATVVSLAGDVRKMTQHSSFMIHNPVSSIAWGDADDFESQAELMRALEDKIINFYVDKTGKDRETVDKWMAEETWFDADGAFQNGFIGEIIQDVAVAAKADLRSESANKFLTKNLIKMKKEENKAKSVLNKIKSFLADPVESNLKLTTADGTEIEFKTEEEKYNLGDEVLVENSRAEDGEYLMSNEETIVVKDGVIQEIKDKDGNEVTKNTPSEDAVTVLNERIDRLEGTIADLISQNETLIEGMYILAENVESGYEPKPRKTPKKDTATQSVGSGREKAEEILSQIKKKS